MMRTLNYLSRIFLVLLFAVAFVENSFAFKFVGDSVEQGKKIIKFNVNVNKWKSDGNTFGFFDLPNGNRVIFNTRSASENDKIQELLLAGATTVYCVQGDYKEEFLLVAAQSKKGTVGNVPAK